AGLAARAAHQDGVDALGVVLGDRAGPLGRLVVGVGVHGEDAQGLAHGVTLPEWPRQKGQPKPAGAAYFFFLVTTGFFAGGGAGLGAGFGATLGAGLGAGPAMNSSATHMALLATTTPTPT